MAACSLNFLITLMNLVATGSKSVIISTPPSRSIFTRYGVMRGLDRARTSQW